MCAFLRFLSFTGKVDNKIDDRLIFDFKDTWRSFWYPLSYEVEHKQTDLEMRNKVKLVYKLNRAQCKNKSSLEKKNPTVLTIVLL